MDNLSYRYIHIFMADRRTISITRACIPAQRLPGFQSRPYRKNDYLTLQFVTRQFFSSTILIARKKVG
jgi:hypothetical protein